MSRQIGWSGIAIALGAAALVAPAARAETTTTYSYTGAQQQFVVPAGVTSIQVVAIGARGGDGLDGWVPALGGRGAEAAADIAVTPGQVLFVFVGGPGGDDLVGGFNGGGQSNGGSGGGASDIRTDIPAAPTSLQSRLIVAGGGGGGGNAPGEQTGAGGDALASGGAGCANGLATPGMTGGELSGGAGGSNFGAAGSFGFGGNGGDFNSLYTGNGGGGGGGWWGGGGGGGGASVSAACGAGGGAGSSHFATQATGTSLKLADPGVAASVTISYGNRGTLAFASGAISAGESSGSATVTVQRTGGAEGPVSVDYATTPGTASAGNDYTTTAGRLTFANGDTTPKTFAVPILNDTSVDQDETFTVTLSDPRGGAKVGAPVQAPITIIDDDGAPPGGGAEPDPDTTITKKPRDKVKLKRGKRVRIAYEFTATVAGSSFACALDGKTAPCTSPFKAPVRKGKHKFSVSATSPTGKVDASPATHTFRVKRPRR